MGSHSGAEGTSEGGHGDTHLWETSRQDRRVHGVYDRLTRIAKEANTGRGDAECVSVSEVRNEGNPHVRFCEEGSRSYDLYPSTRPAIQNIPKLCETHSKYFKAVIHCRTSEGTRSTVT